MNRGINWNIVMHVKQSLNVLHLSLSQYENLSLNEIIK